jgi:hypothetical protein
MSPAETAPVSDFGMTDLEEALRSPDGAAVRSGLIEHLGKLSADIAAQMRGGLSPGDFTRADAVAKALAAAREVVINVK